MRLDKRQKDVLLSWISEGLRTDEINRRAARFSTPFHVNTRITAYYRKSRAVKIDQVQTEAEFASVRSGLAKKTERVAKLQLVAELLMKDLLSDGEESRLWLDQIKGIGSNENFERIEYKAFNKAEVDALRGVLDDIAAEVGDRAKNRRSNLNFNLSRLSDDQLERIADGETPRKVIMCELEQSPA